MAACHPADDRHGHPAAPSHFRVPCRFNQYKRAAFLVDFWGTLLGRFLGLGSSLGLATKVSLGRINQVD